MLNLKDKFPALKKFRGNKNDSCKYFGPYASSSSVDEVLDVVQRVFQLRSCRDSVFNNRTRPCLLYQIKRCSAPCVEKISQHEYAKLVKDVINFLEGKNVSLQEELSKKMEQASLNEDFETAIVLRDRIRALTGIQNHANLEYSSLKSVDVIGVVQKDGVYCVELFFIRGGQNCGNTPYFIKNQQDVTISEVLEAFLSSFYSAHIIPKEIIISEDIENKEFLEDALNTKINTYQKGNKFRLIDSVKKNAALALERKLQETKSIKDNLKEMMQYFELKQMPKRIEVYDNSHNQGSYAIGAMIVATPDGFDKKQYRTFDIKNTPNTNDDFAMMQEVLKRRFERMSDENRPDIILLDGGLGQLHAVHNALKDYDLSGISIIAISKGVDRNAGREFYHQKDKESFSLPYRSSVAFYLQNIRDEAHRFAIGTHRKKREKSIVKSRIDDVEGVGSKRKKDLLNYFGSVEAIRDASVEDISRIPGINKKTAENIYNYFHK